MRRLGLHATLHREGGRMGAKTNGEMTVHLERACPSPPPSIYRHACCLVVPLLIPLLLAALLSISSSSSEMLFVVAFINQHSADATAAAAVLSFFLSFHQRSRLSDSRLPSSNSSIAGLALQGVRESHLAALGTSRGPLDWIRSRDIHFPY